MILEIFKMWNRIIVEVCLTFPVNLRWFRVLVPCSAATKDCRLTHGINLDFGKTFLEINFLRLIHPEIILKVFNLTTCKETEKQSLKPGRTKTIHTSEDRLNQSTIPMTTFAARPLTTSSTMPVEIPQSYMVGQQRQQISELQFDKFSNLQAFLAWKIRFENQVTTCSDFPSDALFVDQRSGDGWFFGRVEILAIRFWKGFSKLRDAGREDRLCSEQDQPEFPVQDEGQPRGAESPKRGLDSLSKTDRLHDLRLWYSIGICWFILCYSSWWQYSGIQFEMGRSSSVSVRNSVRWYIGKSVQIEDTWVCATQNRIGIVRHGDSSVDIDVQLPKSWKPWWRGVWIRNFRLRNVVARHGRVEFMEQWSRVERGLSALKEEKVSVYQWKEKDQCSQGDRCSFRHETQDRAQKTRTHCRHAFWANRITRLKCVEEEKYPRQKSNQWVHFSTTVQLLFERYLHANALWTLATAQLSIL